MPWMGGCYLWAEKLIPEYGAAISGARVRLDPLAVPQGN